jgi:hypothetical protein
MKAVKLYLISVLMIVTVLSCDTLMPDEDPEITDTVPMGILDMAFVYRAQAVPQNRVKKVDLCLAYTAEDLYYGRYFIQTNVSDAVVHYRFELPPGDYFYYATVICLCGGDSCKYAGFPGQNGLVAAGGKVSVLDGKITSYTTNFH